MTYMLTIFPSFRTALALAVSILLFGLGSAHAIKDQAKIVLLTWRGETSAEQGFRQGLTDAGVDADIVAYDANRDRSALAAYIRDNLDQIKNADIVYTFGTTTAQVLHSASRGEATHVFNIVSDPVAAGLIDSMDQPGGRITGTSHVVPLDIAFQLINGVKPFQTLGFLFDPNEENTVTRMRSATSALKEMGKTVKPIRIVPEAGVLHQQIDRLEKELQGVDILYVPSGSSLIANAEALFQVLPDDVLVVGAVDTYVKAGAAFALGPDYFERGLETARSAVRILNGTHPGNIPVNRIDIDGISLIVRKNSKDAFNLDLSSVEQLVSTLE